VYKKGLIADWGFSCLVEMKNTPKILFDTGTDGSILLSNMKKLDINPLEISEIFISYGHYDHTGGLQALLKLNKDIKIYIPQSYVEPSGAKEVIRVKKSLQIHENVLSTGELLGVEQSMVVKTDYNPPTTSSHSPIGEWAPKGLVVITGCSHPGVGNILKSASQFGKIYALIGGLHGFSQFNLIKDLSLICPCHCTQYMSEIKSLYTEKCIEGRAGKVIEI